MSEDDLIKAVVGLLEKQQNAVVTQREYEARHAELLAQVALLQERLAHVDEQLLARQSAQGDQTVSRLWAALVALGGILLGSGVTVAIEVLTHHP